MAKRTTKRTTTTKNGKSRSGARTRKVDAYKRPIYAISDKAKKFDLDYDRSDGIILKSTKKIILTIQDAERHIQHCAVEGERSLREDKVNFLLEQAINGSFRPEIAQLATARVKGDPTIYRVNGQHTAWMRCLIGLDSRFNYKMDLLHYECEDMAALKRLYATFDRGFTRTETHIAKTMLIEDSSYAAFNQKTLGTIRAGLKLWLWQTAGEIAKHSSDELIHLMQTDYRSLCILSGNYLKSTKHGRSHIAKAGVIAAYMATFATKPRVAQHFWPAVRDGFAKDAKNGSDARLRLNRELLTIITHTKPNSPVSTRKIVGNEEIYRGCIRAWKNWRIGKEMKGFRWTSQTPDRPKIN